MPAATKATLKPGPIYWTAYTELEGSSQPTDPLRFDMYTERLGNLLLPGLTNRTERLRYLSMVCAGIGVATRVGQTSVRDQRRAFLPFERGWALAMTIGVNGELKAPAAGPTGNRSLKPEFRGFRGANRVLAHYRTIADESAMKPTAYVLLIGQDAQGGLGAYLVTLRHFGFIQRDSVALTASGRELAAGFDQRLRGAPLTALADPKRVSRRVLERLGDALALDRPSLGERQLVSAAIFGSRGGVTADCVDRVRRATPGTTDPEVLFRGIANRDGDALERYAQYAIDFDPMRVALLQAFSRLGRSLRGRAGPTRLGTLMTDDLEEAIANARAAANQLAGSVAPGMDPVSNLANDLAVAGSASDAVHTMVAFHRREGRAWITSDRPDHYSIGHHGSFEEPSDSFNGYTLGRALQLVADAEATP